MQYSDEEQRSMDKRAKDAAQRERERDPNVTDPKGTQARMDEAVLAYRRRLGLEK